MPFLPCRYDRIRYQGKKRENETPRGKVPVSVVFSQLIFINLQYKGTLVRN